MMIKFISLFVIAATTVVDGFTPRPIIIITPSLSPQKTKTTTVLFDATTDNNNEQPTYFEDLELACEAVLKFGELQPDQLHELADKVESGAETTCLFETTSVLCEKEINDRKDVAEVLRMQAELQLRMDAIENSSLFVDDVHEEALIRQRDMEMELLSEDGM